MAEMNFSCDIEQGFNFQKDAQKTVGHLISLSIGGSTDIKSDMDVEIPGDENNTKEAVVGIMESFAWKGGHGDPIEFKFNVSSYNKQKLDVLRHQKLKSTELKIKYCIWMYDPTTKTWFIASQNGADGNPALEGLIQKGEPLNISVDTSAPASEVANPENWKTTIGMMPKTEAAQTIWYAAGSAGEMRLLKPWGVKVTK